MKKSLVVALAAVWAAGAYAQSTARPNPADAKAGGNVPTEYESVFKDYRRYSEPAAASWRGANEDVGRLGGHSGHVPRLPVDGKPAEDRPAPGRDPHGAHGGRK